MIPTRESNEFASDETTRIYLEHIKKKEEIRIKIEKM